MRLSRTFLPMPVIVCGLLLGEAAVRPAQVARADQWEWYISPDDVYCEGCCTPGLLCCSSSLPCRIAPPTQ